MLYFAAKNEHRRTGFRLSDTRARVIYGTARRHYLMLMPFMTCQQLRWRASREGATLHAGSAPRAGRWRRHAGRFQAIRSFFALASLSAGGAHVTPP